MLRTRGRSRGFRRRRRTPWAVILPLALIAILAAGAVWAPYLFVLLSPWLDPHVVVAPKTPALSKGRMVDDYFAVQAIGPDTFAIGEPRYYQQNYAYLLIGQRAALLFDSGTGVRDIRPVVHRLTQLPLTVLVSHLHFDHLGGAARFPAITLIDEPSVRADVGPDHRFTPGAWEWLGRADGLAPPSLKVSRWLKPGATIDLGGRVVRVISTPGHTPSSISLYDPGLKALFAGDFIYPTTLYAFLPGSSLSAYQATARRLLATLPPDTILWTAHCCRVGEDVSAPWLGMADVADLDHALTAVRAGHSPGTGVFPVRHAVNRQMTLATGFAWNNR